MPKLIRTRRGAVLYAVIAPILAALLLLIPMAEAGNPFVYVDPYMDTAANRPIFLALAAWMGFALCTWIVLVRWIVERIRQDGKPNKGIRAVAFALLMWIPAALGALVIYVLNLVALLRGQYPVRPWRLSLPQVILPAALLLAIFLISSAADQAQLTGPASTPEQALLPRAKGPQVLAKLPQEDGSLLLISFGACGVVEETPGGWVLREAYKATLQHVTDGENGAHAYTHRSQTGDTDAVVVWKGAFPGDDTGWAERPPRDSAGSVFTAVTEENAFVTEYYYYALTDADAPGYELRLE